MCLIIVNPSGVALPENHLDNGWQRNSDGGGYMFAQDGRLIIRKPFYTLTAMKESLEVDRHSSPHSPFVIHFRYATHGERTEENCHPHPLCGGTVGLAHNGVLRDFLPPFDADYSDTVQFCRTVLSYRRPEDVMSATFRTILASMIGKGNKFVLLQDTGAVSIVNESQGVWDSGNWYSNDGYKGALPTRFQFPVSESWDDFTESEWRGAKAQERTIETDEDDLAIMDAMVDEIGWSGMTASQQDEYIDLYELVYGPIAH